MRPRKIDIHAYTVNDMSTNQVLSLSFRPRVFKDLIGQKTVVHNIRRHQASRPPNAWLFSGETGCGKTTIARILALALQCRHQKLFGNPCPRCHANAGKFDIIEINASDITGIDDLRNTLQGSDFVPSPGSRCRVYVLDEAQRLSKSAQNLLLKYFEDCPHSTRWIVCTTEPDKILRTLRRRCTAYTIPSLDLDGTRELVARALTYIKSDLDPEPLADALMEAKITSAGLILNGVEKYAAGSSPEAAAMVELTTEFNTHELCRCICRGAWDDVAKQMRGATADDARVVRAAVAGYMREILLAEPDVSDRTSVVAKAIKDLASLAHMEESLQLSATVAVLYGLCAQFQRYSH
jgi:DNA polymerase III subunit gamma/tau